MWRVHSAEHPGAGTGDGAGRPTVHERAPDRRADLAAAVQAARDGDEAAFRVLFRAVQPGLLRYLGVLVGGRSEDAEDIASEAWLQVARDLGRFSGDSDGFRAWVATIARNRAMDHLRRQRRRPVADLPVEYLADLAAAEDTAGAALTTVTTADALALIARLPRDQAEAVLLRVVLELDAESAARVLGKRSGSVRMAAHRGLRRLAGLLEAGGGAAGGLPGRAAGEPPAGVPAAVDRRATRKISPQGVTPRRAATLKDMR
ncbi:RNA polymerase sigma factor [Kitasatospora sp. NPDC048540]|uniref:RNA polymerase sigma factor n=1 Tax=unclassified Kitasatospora TaxID=2633591 RepID=UPI0009E8B1E7|nr:RNA polymerase sigma factor [Kitasatospora sp. MBT63]